MSTELFDLLPVLFDKSWMRSLELRNEFGDVVNFCVVEVAGDDFSDPERFVAVVSANF
jgi:hypothetical protein